MHSLVHKGIVGKGRTIEKHLTQQVAINHVKDFVKEIQHRGISLSHVILFGSYARNEQHEYSDIDVAMAADNFQGLTILDAESFRDLKIKQPYTMIDLHTFI